MNIHSQYPMNWNPDDSNLFEKCSVCLDTREEIPCCVMLPCRHRFCLDCVSLLDRCPLCRLFIPYPRHRLTFDVGMDEIWLDAFMFDLMYDVAELIRDILGYTSTLDIPSFEGISYSDLPLKHVERHINLILQSPSSYPVRGLSTNDFLKHQMYNIYDTILRFNSTISIPTLMEYITKRWPRLKIDDVIFALQKYIAEGHAKEKDGK